MPVGTGSASFANGNVDEVGIYAGVALSASEVETIYDQGGSATPGNLLAGPQISYLKHYYRMGDHRLDSSTVLIDQIPGGINMTGTGGITIETDVP